MRQVLSQKRFEGFRVFIWGQNNNKRLIAWKTLFFRRIFILERINLIIMIEFLLQNRIIFIFFLSISNHFTLGSSVVLKATKNNFERSFSKKIILFLLICVIARIAVARNFKATYATTAKVFQIFFSFYWRDFLNLYSC